MQHITQEERYQIHAFLKVGYSRSAIARELNRSKSSISEEINRNTGGRGYRPKQAHEMAQQRWSESHGGSRKMRGDLLGYIEEGVKKFWSPEQIAARAASELGVSIHHETIYQYIYADKEQGGDLHTYLRRANRTYKKRYGTAQRKGKIKNRRDIAERPEAVDERTEVGHWEGDTVRDPDRNRSIVTLVERKTRLTVMIAVASLHAEVVSQAIIIALLPLAAFVKTLTLDNGKEFAAHQKFGKSLKADVFFATPYHSWERGTNENTNGLIRQFYPKRKVRHPLPELGIVQVEQIINSRPRKILDYKTPLEAFTQETGMTIHYQ